MIVTRIWQKPSNVEREVSLIFTDFWQLFPHIFGETLLIVTNIWRNHTLYRAFKNNTDWPASTGTNDFAQSSTALSADEHRVVDCEYVDTAALAVSALFWSRATPRSACSLSLGKDDALLKSGD